MGQRLILVSDIWGRTPHLEAMATQFKAAGHGVVVVDPYDSESQMFQDETVAYQAFMDRCGHDHYVKLVERQLLLKNAEFDQQRVVIIGFSAGASAAWRAISDSGVLCHEEGIAHLIGFYPSQIRNYTHLKPLVPCTLIFPSAELHFDVAEVMADLEHDNSVCSIQANGLHGFMNECSTNFDVNLARAIMQSMLLPEALVSQKRLLATLALNTSIYSS